MLASGCSVNSLITIKNNTMKKLALLFLVFFFSTSVMANEVELIRQYYKMEAVAYRTFGEMSLCAIQDTPAAQKRLDAALKLGDEYSQGLASQWPKIAKEWQKFSQFIEEHRTYEELTQASFAARLEAQADELKEAFREKRPNINKLSEETSNDIQMLLSLDMMLSGYTFFNASLFGGHASINTNIETEHLVFEKHLEQIKDPEFKQNLSKNWLFIKKTLLDYNERSAVYIVDRTGHKMRQMLLQRIAEQEAK